MSKKKLVKSPTPARTPSVAGLRSGIDRIDQSLVKLLNERAELAQQIGQVKDSNGAAVYDPGREAEVVQRALEASKGPLSADALRNIFREIISGARAVEKHLNVAYLGPPYSYSHIAAVERFGQSVRLVPVGAIGAVFEEVNRGHVDFGVVPLENSTDGRVADTLDMFARLSVRICGEVQMRIHHTLLAKCERSEIREIYSKPQALSQCRNWLARHMPTARTIEVASTSTAAQVAAEKQGAAAIASKQAGQHFGLNALVERIEDNAANVTRFAVIGHAPAARTGRDKTAIMFEIPHKPGALADATAVLKKNELNMSWIESFPMARPEGGYFFFVECEGHLQEPRVARAMEALEKKTVRFELLGSYPVSPVVE